MTLRVLHLTTAATPIAGAELTSILLARELPAHDIEFEVCTLAPDGVMQERIAALGRPTSSLGAGSAATWAGGLWKLEQILARVRPHIVHAQLFHAGILGAIAAKRARVPFVLTRQYVWSVDWYRGWLARKTDAWAARQAALVIAISTEAKTFLESKYGLSPDKIRLVHNAADVDRFAGLARQDVASVGNDGKVRMAYVASLHPRKSHPNLLQAVRILVDRGKRVQLLLIGDGVERATLERMVADLRIGDSVSFLGWRNDVAQLLTEAHLYVHNAAEEAFGIAIAEAMAAGLPVVATRTGGIPDVVADGETGFLVPVGDATALADSLTRLIDEPRLRAKMGAAGKARAQALFAPKKLVDGYVDVFRRIAGVAAT